MRRKWLWAVGLLCAVQLAVMVAPELRMQYLHHRAGSTANMRHVVEENAGRPFFMAERSRWKAAAAFGAAGGWQEGPKALIAEAERWEERIRREGIEAALDAAAAQLDECEQWVVHGRSPEGAGRGQEGGGRGDNVQVGMLRWAVCRAAWRLLLQRDTITGVGQAVGFKNGRRGAVGLTLSRGLQAWFKPCGAGREWPEQEVMAGHVAEVMGVRTVSPAVMRIVAEEEMMRAFEGGGGGSFASGIVGDHRRIILGQEIEACGMKRAEVPTRNEVGGGVGGKEEDVVLVGVMLGWWHGVEDAFTIPKILSPSQGASAEDVAERRMEMPALWATQTMENHLLFYLLGTLRHVGYNEYLVRQEYRGEEGKEEGGWEGGDGSGVLVAIDLDRSSLYDTHATDILHRLSACHLCRPHVHTIRRYERAEQEGRQAFDVLQMLMASEMVPLQLSQRDGDNLVQRIEGAAACLRQCVSHYGPSARVTGETPGMPLP